MKSELGTQTLEVSILKENFIAEEQFSQSC